MSASATKSRIASMYYDTPPRILPDLPKTPAERRQVMADAVFASVLALQGLLNDRDPHVVMKAAGMILDVDKTQMRHSSHVSGTVDPCPLGPLDSDWGSTPKPTPASAPPERERPASPLPSLEKMVRMSHAIDDEDDEFDDDEFEDNPFDNAPQPKPANVADPSVAFVERMRKALQRVADREGTGEVVTWGKAEKAARYAIELRKRNNAEATQPTNTPPRE